MSLDSTGMKTSRKHAPVLVAVLKCPHCNENDAYPFDPKLLKDRKWLDDCWVHCRGDEDCKHCGKSFEVVYINAVPLVLPPWNPKKQRKRGRRGK